MTGEILFNVDKTIPFRWLFNNTEVEQSKYHSFTSGFVKYMAIF